MDHKAAAETYMRDSLEHAPPIKIVRLLYQGAIRFIDQALAQDASDPRSRFCDFVWRVEAIVTELRLALNDEQNPDVAENLRSLYLFVEGELGRAIVERSPEPMRASREVLGRLLEAWNHVEIATAEAA